MIAPLLSLSAFLFLLCHLLQVQQWSRGFRGAFLQDGATPKAASANPAEVNPAEVSIVLPVRNEAETLPQLLHDLAAGTSMPKEVIVVDDDSVDGTLEAIAAMEAEREARIARQHFDRVAEEVRPSPDPAPPAGFLGATRTHDLRYAVTSAA